MFLNPQLPEILACAYERKVVVSAANGVNLNFARDEVLEAIVKYRVRALTCSIDGATQESYARYRVNGDLDRVLGHVDRIRELRQQYGSAFPRLVWQFVVFGHNEHELETARRMARERGMEFLPRLSWQADYSPVANPELVSIQTGLGASDRAEFRKHKGVEYTRDICYQLWRAPVLNWDGRMLGCCVNFWQDFGPNVFDIGLTAAMAHPNMEYARQMLLGHAPPRPGISCTKCEQYKAMAESGSWLVEEEIEDDDSILVGIVPSPLAGTRFAQFSIAPGAAPAGVPTPHPRAAGKLFRFGVDTAFYFTTLQAGEHTIFVNALRPSGWHPCKSHVIHIAERPVCQQLSIDLES